MNNSENVYCRLCAELKPQNKHINLQTNEEKCQEIFNKLTRFNVQMNFTDNILPKMACYTCVNSLQRAYAFVISVEKAQSTLNDLILMRQIKKEENVSDDENFAYEPTANYETENDNIKVEVEIKGTTSKPHLPENTENSSENKKTKNICNSLESLPLSQLKLSWKDYNWMCTYCETQFPTITELHTHSMQYHKACNPYRCTDCKIRKLRLDSFIQHVKRHRKYLKFSCYICSKRFRSLPEAVKHKGIHKLSNNICGGCNKNFESEEELTKHVETFRRGTRAGEPPPIALLNDSLTCTICGKSCKNKHTLSTHLLIHTERKKDHTCEVCGKCFFLKGALAGHMIQHSDARPFQCEICKATFKTLRRLKTHIGVHNGEKPFACDQCGRCFRLKSQLVNHSIIHTDSLPYVCSYCNKSFRFRTILNQHVRQHTGVKPYSCTICQRDFTNWPNYNKHMKRRHGMDMAKKKHTPEGMYPIDPATGEVVLPEKDKIIEWKKKMMEQKNERKPKIGKVKMENRESNNN